MVMGRWLANISEQAISGWRWYVFRGNSSNGSMGGMSLPVMRHGRVWSASQALTAVLGHVASKRSNEFGGRVQTCPVLSVKV